MLSSDSEVFYDATRAMKAVPRDIRNQISRETKKSLDAIWKGEVTPTLRNTQDAKVLGKGVRARGGNPPALLAAQSTKALSGGLVPKDLWAAIEFGTKNRNKRKRYTAHSRKGRAYQVTRHTTRQLPQRVPSGRVLYPALARTAPRVISLWAQVIVRSYAQALEGK